MEELNSKNDALISEIEDLDAKIRERELELRVEEEHAHD